MDTSTTDAIVVGITGAGQEQAALRFAAECARREDREVVLVHVVSATGVTPAPGTPVEHLAVADAAQRVVEEVSEEFEELTRGTVEFRALAVSGNPARVLVGLSREARMVVVQHRREQGLGRFFTGSTVNGAAAHAQCPVVSVNPEWTPETSGEVVIGLHEGGQPRPVLEEGFAWAVATGAPVRLAHAWRLDPAYDDLVTASDIAAWREQQQVALRAAVQQLAHDHPDVEIAFDVRHMSPADVIVDDSRTASLVVVGRHDARRWTPQRLGAVARIVLRESLSPVMVVPLRQEVHGEGHGDVRGEAHEDWGLEADEVSPQT